MSEFIEQEPLETLEAPKKQRKPRTPKAESQIPYDVKEDLFDLTFLEEDLVATEKPVEKRGKGRPKKIVEPVAEDDSEPTPPKPKRKQTDKQKQNFIKALEVRKKNIELRKVAKELEKAVKEEQQEAKKQIIEKKVLKKAKCLKKRELLEQTALDDLPSDEDIPDAIIEKVIKKQRAKAQSKPKPVAPVEPVEPPKPKYNFV
jgi:hypothetical protein